MQIPIEVPDGVSGKWAVQSFEVTEQGAAMQNLRCILNNTPSRAIVPGKYKRLIRNDGGRFGPVIVMSNTPAEVRDHIEFIQIAKMGGSVLIHGLGLGVALKAILESDEVEEVTVIEKSMDVINLSGPTYLADSRVKLYHADAMEWKATPGRRFSAVWHDIWDTICETNLQDMHTLHRRYGRRCDWQGSWCRYECENQRRMYG